MKFTLTSESDFQNGFSLCLVSRGAVIGSFRCFRNEDGPQNSAAVIESERGKGYGKLLLLKAMQVAADYDIGFESDCRGLTLAQERVYSSLIRDNLIEARGLGVFTLTGAGDDFVSSCDRDGAVSLPMKIANKSLANKVPVTAGKSAPSHPDDHAKR